MLGLDQIAKTVQAASGSVVGGMGTGTAAMGTPGVPFSSVVQQMVQQSTSLDQKASTSVTGLLNGSGTEIHEAMIATQKADMAFELALQVRNKAVGAYQTMMAMQF